MTPLTKAQLVNSIAREVGFDLVGIAPAGPVQRASYYRDWLAAGYSGTMEYLRRHADLREQPVRLLPGAHSVICVALKYGREPVTAPEEGRPVGRVAAYARGRDYHVVLRTMLHELVKRLRERLQEPFAARICVDTAPVLERELARAAGLGWIGKNTSLLNRQLGSYLFLGEVLTTLELTPDQPVADHCARCTRCLDACPTSALRAPHQLDASRCISYLTIEHRGEVREDLQRQMRNWVFGCDVCQEVCPYNRRAPLTTHPEIAADHTPARVDLLELARLGSSGYRRLTHASASARASRVTWRRNAVIALGNTATPQGQLADEIRQALTEAAGDDESAIRHAARHALERLAASGARRRRSELR